MGIGLPPGPGENAMLDEFADIDLMDFSSHRGGLPSLTVLVPFWHENTALRNQNSRYDAKPCNTPIML